MKIEIIPTKDWLYDKCENMEQLYDKYYYPLLVENKELKKQLEEYQKELEKADSITQSCIFNGKEESKISYRECLNTLDKMKKQQEEFIKLLEGNIKFAPELGKELMQEILQKYIEIIER